MGTNTKISWTEQTWNPLAGCSPVGPECLHCYAATMAKRLEAMGQAKYKGTAVRRGSVDVFTGKINLDEAALQVPLRRKKPTMYFVNSMSDLFHREVPFDFIDKVFAVMALCPQHIFQVLTKRAERMAEYVTERDSGDIWGARDDLVRKYDHWKPEMYGGELVSEGHPGNPAFREEYFSEIYPEPDWPLPNVWLGVSCGIQKAKSRIDQLREIPAAIRFVSFEPLLEDLREIDLSGINWAITGGESGPHARPCNVDWIRSIGKQCQAAGMAWFHKQFGSNCIARGKDPAIANYLMHGQPSGETVQLGADWKLPYHDERLNLFRIPFKDRAGADPVDWPEEFRVQQMPEENHV